MLGLATSIAGVSGFIGYNAGKFRPASNIHHSTLFDHNPNVNFKHLSADLLMKLLNSDLTLTDRSELEKQLIWFNHRLYAPTAVGRRFGVPGCYSIEKEAQH